MVPTYIIEHMEKEDDSEAIPPWVELEYKHMRALAGADAQIHFTNLSKVSSEYLATRFAAASAESDASACCHTSGIMALIGRSPFETGIDKVCLLDPKAESPLDPQDGDRFSCFLFGGILGDDPPRDRTAELRVLGFPSRHLGPVQMTTDTALGVTKKVAQNKVPLEDIPYIDYPTIVFNPSESVEMPFRYIAQGQDPVLPHGMRDLLHEDLNKSFDF